MWTHTLIGCALLQGVRPHQQSTHTPPAPHHAATKQAQYSRMSHTLNILLSFSFFIFLKYPTNQANKIPKSDMHNLRQSIHKINKKLRSKTFSVPGKRTNRSLARTKACKIWKFFFQLGKKKKKKIQISVGTWWFLVADRCCLVFCWSKLYLQNVFLRLD